MENTNKSYPLEWLDILITVTLNPTKTIISDITIDQAKNIHLRLKKECSELQTLIKNQVFAITKHNHIELLIRRYHSSLIILIDRMLENKKHSDFKRNELKEVSKIVISCLDELLSFIEIRFSSYLGLEERVPQTYLSISKRKLRNKLDEIKNKVISYSEEKEISTWLINRLYSFTCCEKHFYKVTFRDLLYKKELIKGLEELDEKPQKGVEYTPLDRLLIYLNFNSKSYMNYFTQNLAAKINSHEIITDKIELLLLYYKVFNQMHHKPVVKLNPNYHDLELVLSNWFMQEIIYLERKMHLSVVPLQGKRDYQKQKEQPSGDKQKVTCVLSTDQIALILRAADESKILVSKSMNELFKTIVPHLSTPYKENLSYDSMRSKSYVAEERDKQISIETLEKLIKRIKEY